MGNTADNRKTEDDLCNLLGGQFQLRSDGNSRYLGELIEDADDMANRDGMTLKEALRIVSGRTRRPYGSPKP